MTIRNKKISQVRFDATNLNAPTVNRALDNVINTVNPFIDEVAQQLNNLEAASGTGQITINPENAASVTNSTFNLYGTNGITFGSNGINSITISQATSSNLTLNVSGASTLTGSQFNLTGANGVTFSTPNSSTLVISQSLNTPVTINGNTGSITANPINIIAEGCCIHTETSGSDTLIISSSAPCNFDGTANISVITPQQTIISGSQPNTILLAHLDTNLAFGAFGSPDTGQAGTEHPYPTVAWYGAGSTGLDTTTWKFGGGAASTNNSSQGFFYCRTDFVTSSLGTPYLENVDGTSGDFTYECWIYPTVTTGYGFQNFMGIAKYAAPAQGFGLYMYLGNLAFCYPAQPGGVAVPYTFTTPNQWYAVAVSRKSNVTRIYVNGGLVATYTGLDYGTGNDIAIAGQSPYGAYVHPFNGNIDEVRYSNVAHYTGSSYTTASVAFPDYSGTAITIVDNCTREFALTGAVPQPAIYSGSYPSPQFLAPTVSGSGTQANSKILPIKNDTNDDIWFIPQQKELGGTLRQASIGLRGQDAAPALIHSLGGGNVKLLGGKGNRSAVGGDALVYAGEGGDGNSGQNGGDGGNTYIRGGNGGVAGFGAFPGNSGSIYIGDSATYRINIGNSATTTSVSGTFIAPILGDVSGTTNATTVTKWQNLPVLNVSGTVANGEVYTWNNAIGKWATYQDGLNDNNVIVQLPMSGTNGSTTFTNIAPAPYPVSAFGNTAITTSVEKWTGSGSAYFDGNGDYLTGSYNSALQFGTNNWTTEFWMNPNAGYGSAGFSNFAAGLVDFRSTGVSLGFLIMVTTTGEIVVWYSGGPVVLQSISSVPTGSWTNVVVQRRNPNLEIYINGVLDNSVSITPVYNQTDGQLAVGGVVNLLIPAGGLQYDGYMSDLRISNIARYTGSFTAPSAPYTNPVTPQTPNIAGDISGTLNAITVTGIQGNPITASTPSSGSSLIWNGSLWSGGIPATASFATSASFATTASWANTANATQIQGIPVTASAPVDGDILVYVSSSNQWQPQNTRYYGVFCDLTTQTASATTAAYPMLLDTTEEALGVSIVSGSRITFAHGGTYNIQFSAQVEKNNANAAEIDIWLRETGSNVPRSNTTVHVQGSNATQVAAWNFVRTFPSGSYAEIMWRTSDTDVELLYQTSGSSPTRPEIPSVIVTVTQV